MNISARPAPSGRPPRSPQRRPTIGARCASSRVGRVALHLICALGDHRLRWHLRGIARELSIPLTTLH